MVNNGLDESKENIIKEFFERKYDKDFKGFIIQAGPGTGKTYLLKKVISRLSEELKDQNIFALSFSNSAVDTISTKLEKNNNIKIKTIASFFIENFIIPFSYTILKNEQIDQVQKNLLKKVSSSFSENNIQNSEWEVMNGIIKKYCSESYFNLFHNIIIQNKIKYIFIDEYQDTQDYCINIFSKIIEKGDIKFFCLGDKNQQINFENDNNAFNGLEEKSLETTYRFGKNILDYTNKVLGSGIINCDKNCNIGNVDNKLGYIAINGNENERLNNLCNFIIKYINDNINIFLGKNNVILFQPATDYGFGDNFNKKLEELLKDNDKIYFSYTEKPVYNIHLKLFFEKVIAFVNGDEGISYYEIEKELDFFYEKGEQKEHFKNIFFDIMKLKKIDEIKVIESLLKNGFKKGGKHKEYFTEISKLLKKGSITFLQAKNKELIDLIDLREDDKIYISTNTITSSKGKEYDNVIILGVYNIQSQGIKLFSEILKTSDEAKRHYYVAVSRAKENIFTFVYQ